MSPAPISIGRSMTGYAACEGALPDGRLVSVSIKSVNQRQLDLALRVPAGLEAWEAELRRLVREHIHRGRVELAVTLERTSGATAVRLEEGLFLGYVAAWRTAAELLIDIGETGKVREKGQIGEPDLSALLRMPGVLQVSAAAPSTGLDEASAAALVALVAQALEQLNTARAAEGAALIAELHAGMQRLETLALKARKLREGAAVLKLTRLRERIVELQVEVSAERLIGEVALLMERSDVEEELIRLRTHVTRFTTLLDAGGELGKPLDFLLQELNREANTLLSKTTGEAGLRLTEVGLAMKLEIERAREQVQNLE